MTTVSKTTELSTNKTLVVLGNKKSTFEKHGLSKAEMDFVNNRIKNTEKKVIVINQPKRVVYVQLVDSKHTPELTAEAYRKSGAALLGQINQEKTRELLLVHAENLPNETLAFAEGMMLANYQFLKYKTNSSKLANALNKIFVYGNSLSDESCKELQVVVDATNRARTLVNEPVIFLTATQLSKELKKLGDESGFTVDVLNKSKIEALKMGGLLAVNSGSQDPPTFTIMEWKPKTAKNKKPYVLVGKGVVYDTGGLSLKPTANSMDLMKSDMAGAAAVGGAMYAIAKAKLPLHVVALVPATDNRPGENAVTPGDVITMMSGTTVEVLNTDAEGRLILADALHYAKRLKPELTIDLATLTGAAVAAIGTFGIVAMGTANEKHMAQLKKSGHNVHERLAEMPFWDDYDELIKSAVAEIKNTGGPYGGAITAGKFLAKFIDYPWIHLDIAGPSFHTKSEGYHSYGGTGVGVRLLFDFFKSVS